MDQKNNRKAAEVDVEQQDNRTKRQKQLDELYDKPFLWDAERIVIDPVVSDQMVKEIKDIIYDMISAYKLVSRKVFEIKKEKKNEKEDPIEVRAPLKDVKDTVDIIVNGTIFLNMILNEKLASYRAYEWMYDLEVPAIAKSLFAPIHISIDPTDRMAENVKVPVLWPEKLEFNRSEYELAWTDLLSFFKKSDIERVKWYSLVEPRVAIGNILDNLVYVSAKNTIHISDRTNFGPLCHINNGITENLFKSGRFSYEFMDYMRDRIEKLCIDVRH